MIFELLNYYCNNRFLYSNIRFPYEIKKVVRNITIKFPETEKVMRELNL